MSLSENALVHRDIKPQNIMLTRSGAKLLDFNIASRVGDPVETVSGTPPYQPPDADLTRWDVSTDLFAVGVTLYELLCDGEHPYPNARPTSTSSPAIPVSSAGTSTKACQHFSGSHARPTEKLAFKLRLTCGVSSRPFDCPSSAKPSVKPTPGSA